MAVPKHKTSKQRSNTRYSQWKIKNPAIGECPKCHEMKLNHRVCPKCGYYDGEQKIEMKAEKE